MEKKSFFSQLDNAGSNFLDYVKARIELLGLTSFEIAAKFLNNLLASVFFVSLLMIGLIFLAIASAIFLGNLIGSKEAGLAVMGALFLLAAFYVFIKRKKIFQKYVIREMADIVFEESRKQSSHED